MMKCLNESSEIIFGVWIHDDGERQRVYESILRYEYFESFNFFRQ